MEFQTQHGMNNRIILSLELKESEIVSCLVVSDHNQNLQYDLKQVHALKIFR